MTGSTPGYDIEITQDVAVITRDGVRLATDMYVPARDGEVAPGVVVHHIGGHTMGLQCISVLTRRGWVVLAADAAHFYENMEKPSPFPIVYSVADMLAGYKKMRGVAASAKHIVPGHDPMVMDRYPAPNADLDGVVVRLDVEPSG